MLSVLETGRHVPFEVRRVFWLSAIAAPEVIRGAHAHKALRQVIFCTTGRCDMMLERRDGVRAIFELTAGGDALYLDGLVWRTMTNFSPDCAMMVLCDRIYDDDVVVRDYDEFRRGR